MGAAGASFSFGLCADDFALSRGVSQGILEALDAGRLSATSVMTTRPSWRDDAARLRAFRGRADIGLHLNLTLGAPLGVMPRFAPSGRLPEIRQLLQAAGANALPEAEIRREIERQFDAFVDAFGAPPDFVDGHQHVQVFPGIRHWLFDCLEAKQLCGKIWLRNSGDRVSNILKRGIEVKKALGITWLARGFAKAAQARGFVTNSGFAGFSCFDPCRDYGLDFACYLRAPGPRHLIMCHPGYCDEELVLTDPVTLTRERELSFLLSPAFIRTLQQRGGELERISMSFQKPGESNAAHSDSRLSREPK
ncbi:ChbG/HpnK family deacetylase [Methylocapsa palsarum]|uniref:ChbG/HpnK family deacetylase n=1 Tax=Methylocapsa palsarum TaxID=1612308 RepID=A0A1I3WZU7_9HYPH|nr:ChbG/HpnK family deacetylase [Methylocapsa palsarum]SFK12935.1 hypothetical protein SAMN05444581_102270 [Methylocapsa palsarum]